MEKPEVIPEANKEAPEEAPGEKWFEKIKISQKGKILILSLVFLTILLALLQVFNRGRLSEKEAALSETTPTPAEEEITSPSAYATDSAVLKIEEELEAIDKNLLEVDLYETTLNPPAIDLEVRF